MSANNQHQQAEHAAAAVAAPSASSEYLKRTCLICGCHTNQTINIYEPRSGPNIVQLIQAKFKFQVWIFHPKRHRRNAKIDIGATRRMSHTSVRTVTTSFEKSSCVCLLLVCVCVRESVFVCVCVFGLKGDELRWAEKLLEGTLR